MDLITDLLLDRKTIVSCSKKLVLGTGREGTGYVGQFGSFFQFACFRHL